MPVNEPELKRKLFRAKILVGDEVEIASEKDFCIFLGLLKDRDHGVRCLVAEDIGEYGKWKALGCAALVQAFRKERNNIVRVEIVESIGILRCPRSGLLLHRALRDPYYLVRGHAALAIGRLEGRRALRPLQNLMEREHNTHVKTFAAGAMALLGAREAVGFLLSALKSPRYIVRLVSAGFLGEAPTARRRQDVVSALKQALRDENVRSVRLEIKAVLFSLGQSRDGGRGRQK